MHHQDIKGFAIAMTHGCGCSTVTVDLIQLRTLSKFSLFFLAAKFGAARRGYKKPSRALRAPLPTCGILYIRVLKLSISTPQVGKSKPIRVLMRFE